MAENKVVLVFALEPYAARRFEALASSFDLIPAATDNPNELPRPGVQGLKERLIVVTRDISGWLTELRTNSTAYQVLYLRSSVMLILDLFSYSSSGIDEQRRLRGRGLQFMDRILSKYNVVSVEDLYLTAPQASEKVARLLEALLGRAVTQVRPLPEQAFPDYRLSAAALLTYVSYGIPAEDKLLPELEVDVLYSTMDGEAGSLLLMDGWSRPERSHVWSEDKSASLILPIPKTDGPFRCRLLGFVVQGDFAVKAFVEGNLVGSFEKSENQPRDIIIDVPITLTIESAVHIVHLVLEFEGTVRPSDVGPSTDTRNLGIALTSFQISSVRSESDTKQRHAPVFHTLSNIRHPDDPGAPNGSQRLNAAATDGLTSDSYDIFQPKIAMVVIRPQQNDYRLPVRFCRQVGCQIMLLVSEEVESFNAAIIQDAGLQVIPIARILDDALEALQRLQLFPDIIVLWDIEKDDPEVGIIAAQMRDPKSMRSDIILKTNDITLLALLQPQLQDYAEVVSMSQEGFIVISTLHPNVHKVL